MTFLNLWALWIAAAVVPALLILYFLKLRRREQTVPSTLLWKRAVQDLQVNAPFQRLRKNLLLLLQLLILALAILALARPIVETTVADEDRVVMLIDRSASMNTVEEDGRTRLEHAKEQAIRLAKTFNRRTRSWQSFFRLGGAEAQTKVMVIAYADRASIISPFTTNTSELEDLISRIEPSDGRTDLTEALELAEAYMSPPMLTQGMEGTPESPETPSKLVLISDGRIGAADDLVLRQGSIEHLPIGAAEDNVAITALRTQRNYEEPERLNVFLTVQNFGPAAADVDVSLYIDGVLEESASLPTLQPHVREPDPTATAPAEALETPGASVRSLSFRFPLNRAAVIEARLSRSDALMVDNSAYAVVPAPRRLRALVVTEGNRLLDTALSGLPLEEYPFITPYQWEQDLDGEYEQEGQSTFDVVIFDKVQPERLPMGNYLFVGALPDFEVLSAGEPRKNHWLIWWDEAHPILRHVALEYVFIGESFGVELPEEAEVLAEGPDGPVMFRYAQEGRHCVVLTFPIERTTWWSKQSFPIFVYNVIRYLGGAGTEGDQGPARPGETLRIVAPAGADRMKLVRPDGETETVVPDDLGIVHYGGANVAGIYRVEDGVAGRDRFAVNLEDPAESDIAPPEGPIQTSGLGTIEQVGAIQTATPEVWRWFIGAALVLVLLEWWIYNRRVMI